MKLLDRELLDSKPKKLFLSSAPFRSAAYYLCSGAFLNALAVVFGASEVIQSYLYIMISLAGVAVVFLGPILNKIRSKKKLTISLTMASKIFTALIPVVPLIFNGTARLVLFMIFVCIAYILQAQSIVSINQWILPFINDKKRASFFGLFQVFYLSITILLSFSAGLLMDNYGGSITSFIILFTCSAVFGIGEIIIYSRIPDSVTPPKTENKLRLRDTILLPLKDKKFLAFCIYMFLFFLIFYIGNSYTMVFFRTYLNLSYMQINLLSLIMTVPQIVLLIVAGKLSDKFGARITLNISLLLFFGEMIFHMFATTTTWFIFIPLSFSISAIANSGFFTTSAARRYELMPTENKLIYDNFYTASIGLGMIFGPLIGGILKDIFSKSSTVMSFAPDAHIRTLFFISTIGLITLQILRVLIEFIIKRLTKYVQK